MSACLVCAPHLGRQILRILTAPTSPCMQMVMARYSLGGAPMGHGDDVLAAPLSSPPYDDIASLKLLKLPPPHPPHRPSCQRAVQTPLGSHHGLPPVSQPRRALLSSLKPVLFAQPWAQRGTAEGRAAVQSRYSDSTSRPLLGGTCRPWQFPRLRCMPGLVTSYTRLASKATWTAIKRLIIA